MLIMEGVEREQHGEFTIIWRSDNTYSMVTKEDPLIVFVIFEGEDCYKKAIYWITLQEGNYSAI